MAVKIISYLRQKDGGFIEVVEGLRTRIEDQNHIPGAIEIAVHDDFVLDQSLWDDVDYLWFFLVDAVVRLRASGSALMQFPDQPTTLSMQRLSRGLVKLTCVAGSRRVAVVDEDLFVDAVASSGRIFFKTMDLIAPKNSAEYERYGKRPDELTKSP